MTTKTTRSINLLLLLALALTATLALLGCSGEEPSYRSMPVSIYIERLHESTRAQTVESSIEAISSIGGPATPYLVKAWKKYDSIQTRCRLAEAIHRVGPAAAEAAPLLIKGLESFDEEIISCAAWGLAGIGGSPVAPAANKMGELLRSSDLATQVNLLAALGSLGAQAEGQIPRMLEAVERDRTRPAAIAALSRLGKPAVTAVRPWLETGTASQRLWALEILSGAGEGVDSVLDNLALVLDDDSPRVRSQAIRAMAQAGPSALAHEEALIERLGDREGSVREAAIAALLALGPDDREALIDATRSSNPVIRYGAVRVIGQYGNLVLSARDQLIRRLGDSDPRVRTAAVQAFSQVGAPIVPVMTELLSGNSVRLTASAATVLGNIGREASGAAGKLRELTGHSDSLVREAARRALSRVQ